MDSERPIETDVTPVPDQTESSIVTSEPLFQEEEEPGRSVYDGSISDSILRSLSGYYNSHSKPGTPYCITRPSQYVYQLVYGSSSDGVHFTDATVATYSLGNYSALSTFRVSDGQTLTVDVTGSTAYVYSSSAQFLPSPYITDSPRIGTAAIVWLLFAFTLVSLVRFIWSLLRR